MHHTDIFARILDSRVHSYALTSVPKEEYLAKTDPRYPVNKTPSIEKAQQNSQDECLAAQLAAETLRAHELQ